MEASSSSTTVIRSPTNRCISTTWFDYCGDGASTSNCAAIEELLAERRQVSGDQVDEIDLIVNIYSSSRVQLKKDRQRRLILRCNVEVDLGGGPIKAIVSFVVPDAYPAVGHPVEVRVSSPNGNKDFISSLTKTLNDEATGLNEHGMPAMLSLLGKATEKISEMPPATLSSDYCCCVTCNATKLRRGEQKHPQPAVRADQGQYVCLVCGSPSIHLPMIHHVAHTDIDDTPCTFCFCGDVQLIHFSCGCKSCFDCFVSFSDLAIGAKALEKVVAKPLLKFDRPQSFFELLQKFVGIPCPNHRTVNSAVICEPGLMKLLPTRSYNRFNFFAMEKTLVNIPGVVFCPLPQCCGYPFITDQPGTVVMCPFCGEMFCVRCHNGSDSCSCENKRAHCVERVCAMDLAESFGVPLLTKRKGAYQSYENSYETLIEGGVAVLVTLRSKQLSFQLPLHGEWYNRLANFVMFSELCPYAQSYRPREQGLYVVVFHGAVLNPDADLSSQKVFSGAILFVVETFYCDDYTLRQTQATTFRLSTAWGENVQVVLNKKRCPTCAKPVLHYLGHGCHMIYGCHPGLPEWCYVCGGKAEGHRCPKGCNLFCKYETLPVPGSPGKVQIVPNGCDCILCPDCKPLRPCDFCTLCPMCTMNGSTSLI